MIFEIVLKYFLLKERPKFNFSLVIGIFVNLFFFYDLLDSQNGRKDRIPSHKKEDKQNQSLMLFFYLKEKQLEIKNFELL